MRERAERDKLLDTSTLICKIVMFAMIAAMAFITLYYGVINKSGIVKTDSGRYIEQWTVYDGDGGSFTTGRSYRADKEFKHDFVVESTLPSDVKDNEYLCFSTGKNIAVYIDGELREDYIESRDVLIPGGSAKRFYMMVPLYASDAGKQVRLVREATIKFGQIVPETFISTLGGIYYYLMQNFGLSFMLSGIVLIFSIVVFFIGVFMLIRYKQKIDMMYGAVGLFIISAWIVTNSYMCPIVFGNYHVDGIVNYMLCLTIPFGPALYLNSIQGGRYRRSMSAIMIACSLNAVVWPILHFTRTFSFDSALKYITAILAVIAISGMAILIVDAKKRNTTEYKFTAIGFFGFLIFSMIEIIKLQAASLSNQELPMVAGLGFFLIFVVAQQVEDLRKINTEKQRAIDISEAKTHFLANMSHEIRTPINAILGMNEMILRENHDKVVEDYAKSIKSSGKMLLMLVNDVLDFSKIEAGKLEISQSRYMMSELLRDVIALVKERADEKNLPLETVIGPNVPEGQFSDEFRIRQILVNLINNAVKYTDEGKVTLKVDGEYTGDESYMLKISVEDTGRGIKQEDQKGLFDAFSRADVKKNGNIEGTGLGLAIVKNIVDSMNGSVGVESEYGVGSKFWVYIPIRVFDKTPVGKAAAKKTVYDVDQDECDFDASLANILAVDDNRSNLTILKLLLKRTGIEPDLCSSGTAAIEKCKEKKYDIILMDHMMPQPDGIETLNIIKNDGESLNRDTHFVVLTANAVAGSRQMYLDAGFVDYLTKPLDHKKLEATLKALIPREKVKAVTPEMRAAKKKADEEAIRKAAEEAAKSGDSGKLAGAGNSGNSGTFAGAGNSGNSGSLAGTGNGTDAERVGSTGTLSGSSRFGNTGTLEGINVAAAAEAGLNSEKIGNTGMLKSNSADNSANGIIGGTMINGMMINGFVKKDIDSIGKEKTGNAASHGVERASASDEGSNDMIFAEFLPPDQEDELDLGAIEEITLTVKQKLNSIDDFDFDTALKYCAGDTEMLREVVSDVSSESKMRADRMRKSMREHDFKSYEIDAHSIKSQMATIGNKKLSELARKHEYAAKDKDLDFILKE
ncbi:MAG: response regulator, partial [Eubacterium sp.]|nr:response regulator [Eubacterium sp.]